MCETGVSSTSPSSWISSFKGRVHLLAVPEHLLLKRCFGTNPPSCQMGCVELCWAPLDAGCHNGADSMKLSKHLALSFTHIKISRAECLNTLGTCWVLVVGRNTVLGLKVFCA